MAGMSQRLRRRVQKDFVAPGSAEEVTRLVADASDSERVQAAIIVCSGGELARVHDGVALAALDWRDVLMRAGLGDDDWSARLKNELGPAATPDMPRSGRFRRRVKSPPPCSRPTQVSVGRFGTWAAAEQEEVADSQVNHRADGLSQDSAGQHGIHALRPQDSAVLAAALGCA